MQGSHTPYGNGAGAFRIGKNSVILTKVGKKLKCFMHEVVDVKIIHLNLHGIRV